MNVCAVLAHGSPTTPAPGTVAPAGTAPWVTSSHWYYRDTVAMSRVLFVIQNRAGRAVARVVLRTRIWPLPWDPQPASPVECIVDVATLPLLLVHRDAEKAATPDLIVRLVRQIRSLVPA